MVTINLDFERCKKIKKLIQENQFDDEDNIKFFQNYLQIYFKDFNNYLITFHTQDQIKSLIKQQKMVQKELKLNQKQLLIVISGELNIKIEQQEINLKQGEVFPGGYEGIEEIQIKPNNEGIISLFDFNLIIINQNDYITQQERYRIFKKIFKIKKINNLFKDNYQFHQLQKGNIINTLQCGTNQTILLLKGSLLIWTQNKSQNIEQKFIILGKVEKNEICNEYHLLERNQYCCIYFQLGYMALSDDTQFISFQKQKLLDMIEKDSVDALKSLFDRQQTIYNKLILSLQNNIQDQNSIAQRKRAEIFQINYDDVLKNFQKSFQNNKICTYIQIQKSQSDNILSKTFNNQQKKIQEIEAQNKNQNLYSTNRLVKRQLSKNYNAEQQESFMKLQQLGKPRKQQISQGLNKVIFYFLSAEKNLIFLILLLIFRLINHSAKIFNKQERIYQMRKINNKKNLKSDKPLKLMKKLMISTQKVINCYLRLLNNELYLFHLNSSLYHIIKIILLLVFKSQINYYIDQQFIIKQIMSNSGGSIESFEQIMQNIDYPKLLQYDLDSNNIDYISHLLFNQVNSEHVIQQLITQTVDFMREKQIKQKLPDFIIKQIQNLSWTLEFLGNFQKQVTIHHDQCIENIEIIEPQPIEILDTYIRQHCKTIRSDQLFKPKFVEIDYISPQNNTFQQSNIKYQQQKSKQKIRPFEPLNQNQQVEFDIQEETLRSQKEISDEMLEKRLQLQKLNQEVFYLIQKTKQQQYKLNLNDKQRDKTQLTYDYEGGIIIVQSIKVDKLPKQLYQVKQLNKISFLQEKNSQSKRALNTKKTFKKNRKTIIIPSEEPIRYNIQPPDITQMIQPKTGVTFFQGNIFYLGDFTKKGPNKIESNFDFTDINSLLEQSNIKLSRRDYNRLTQQGNLSREFLEQSKLHDTTEHNMQTTLLMNIQEESTTKNNISTLQKQKSNITFHSNIKMQELISDPSENKIQQAPKLQNQPTLPTIKKQRNNSVLDDFNKNLVKGQWGQIKSQPIEQAQTHRAQKSTLLEQQQTLYQIQKQPRDRYQKQVQAILKQSNHLAAPMPGQTFGHGLSLGFNPLN